MYSILLYIPSAKARPAARGRADFIFESTNCQAIQHKGGMVSVMCSLGEGPPTIIRNELSPTPIEA